MSSDLKPSILPNEISHPWHVWINQFADAEAAAGKPRPHSLYEFKSMLNELTRLDWWLRRERKGELPNHHQHCSRCAPECIEKNELVCALGTKCAACPILLSLRASLAAQQVPEETADQLAAFTCCWHIYSRAVNAKDDYFGFDTSEGYIQDEGDRRYWENLYTSLAAGDEAQAPDQA